MNGMEEEKPLLNTECRGQETGHNRRTRMDTNGMGLKGWWGGWFLDCPDCPNSPILFILLSRQSSLLWPPFGGFLVGIVDGMFLEIALCLVCAEYDTSRRLFLTLPPPL